MFLLYFTHNADEMPTGATYFFANELLSSIKDTSWVALINDMTLTLKKHIRKDKLTIAHTQKCQATKNLWIMISFPYISNTPLVPCFMQAHIMLEIVLTTKFGVNKKCVRICVICK